MKKLFITLFLLVATLSILQSQQRQGRRGQANGAKMELKLIGQLTDASSGNGLEFATVSVYSKRDSSLIGGGLSDVAGKFSVDIKPGPMYAVIEYISYETKSLDIPFDRDLIKSGERQIDLGQISMSINSTQLEAVEIRAEKSETQFSLDKKVFNVGKDLANQGGSAEEILDNVPSVTVDIDGNVSLRGSGGVRILVDGRPSSLVGIGNTNGLKNIPANMIDKVEVVTNPSAKYEAEGMAGIINIVLKKDTGAGFNASFDGTVGYPEQQGAGANLNYRKGNLNWFANYSIRHRVNPGSGFTYQERTINDVVQILDSNRERNREGLSNSIRLGADYFFNDKAQLTGSLTYRTGDDSNLSTIQYDSLFRMTNVLESQFLNSTIRTDDETEDENNLQYSLNFRKTFSERDHNLNVSLEYRDQSEVESSFFNEIFTPAGETGFNSLKQRSSNDEGESTWLLQIDYSKPLGKDSKYELGLRSSIRDIANDYLVEEENNGVFQPLFLNNQLFDNEFVYDENIHAAYGTYGNKFGKFSYQLGMRVELSDVTTTESNTNNVNARDYLNFFPSAHLNYEIAEGNAMQVSYSRRINRPRFWSLNPFFTLSDRINLFGGNPNLDPEYTDSYELGNIKYWDNITLSSSLFYRHTKNNIQRIQRLNDDGTTIRIPENVGTGDDYGLDLNISFSGIKWLKFDANGNFFQTQSTGFIDEKEFNVDDFTWFGRMTARVTFFDSDLQIRTNYRGGRDVAQGSQQGVGSIDLGWSKDFMDDNLTFTLSVRDLLNSRKWQGITQFENFFQRSEFQWRARTTTLTVSYRINQKKKRGGSRGGDRGGGEGEF